MFLQLPAPLVVLPEPTSALSYLLWLVSTCHIWHSEPMTPFFTTHNSLLFLPSSPHTSLSLRERQERTLKITSCHSTYGVHLTVWWMTPFDWGCSSAHLRVLRPSSTSSFLMLLTPNSPHSLWCSFSTFSYPSVMMREWRSYYPITRTQLPVSWIISMNGITNVACVRSSLMIGSSYIGSSKPYSPHSQGFHIWATKTQRRIHP